MTQKDKPTDPSILFVKPGAISAEDKAELKSVGIIVIEIDDPGSVKFIRAGVEIASSDLLGIAMRAMKDETAGGASARSIFGRLLTEQLASK